MPTLHCSKDNNDINSKLSLEIKILDTDSSSNSKWLNYEIIFHIGTETYLFSSKNRKAITHTGLVAEIGKFAFSIEPYNELENLTNGIEKFLASNKESFRFEPSDPSFELIVERTNFPGQFKVYFWVDAGNTTQLEYTWDGIGLRMVTSEEELRKFLTDFLPINHHK